MGVEARRVPQGTRTDCNTPFPDSQDDPSSGILMTAYTSEERSTILDVDLGAFLCAELGRPKSFVAWVLGHGPRVAGHASEQGFYSQLRRAKYPARLPRDVGWDQFDPMAGANHASFQSRYRVDATRYNSRRRIRATRRSTSSRSRSTSVPTRVPIYIENQIVSRTDVFDRHYDWAPRH